jgi:hypothetical protein
MQPHILLINMPLSIGTVERRREKGTREMSRRGNGLFYLEVSFFYQNKGLHYTCTKDINNWKVARWSISRPTVYMNYIHPSKGKLWLRNRSNNFLIWKDQSGKWFTIFLNANILILEVLFKFRNIIGHIAKLMIYKINNV